MRQLLCALLIAIPAPAFGLDQYRCVVEDFIGFSKEHTFVEKNMKKKFVILWNKDEIIVFVKSKEFRDSEGRFTVISSDVLDVAAIRDGSGGKEMLVLPKNPASDIDRNGYFNATISLQSSSYNNTWLLRCVE